MDIRRVISNNLSAWMAASPKFDTIDKLSEASGVGFGTVQRAKDGTGNLTVLKLDKIARAFKRTAIDLLRPVGQTEKTLKDEPYAIAADSPPQNRFTLNQNSPDEADLLRGYKDASPEVRQILLTTARQAMQKKPKAADQ
jgi:hypothetical protein